MNQVYLANSETLDDQVQQTFSYPEKAFKYIILALGNLQLFLYCRGATSKYQKNKSVA